MADIVTDGASSWRRAGLSHARRWKPSARRSLDTLPIERSSRRARASSQCFNEEAFHHKGKYFECPPSVPYRGYQLEGSRWCRGQAPAGRNLDADRQRQDIDLMAQKGLEAMVKLEWREDPDEWCVPITQPAPAMAARKKLART